MKRILGILILLVSVTFASLAQNEIKVEAPGVVAVDEQFNVTFIIEGEKEPTDFSWTPGRISSWSGDLRKALPGACRSLMAREHLHLRLHIHIF